MLSLAVTITLYAALFVFFAVMAIDAIRNP